MALSEEQIAEKLAPKATELDALDASEFRLSCAGGRTAANRRERQRQYRARKAHHEEKLAREAETMGLVVVGSFFAWFSNQLLWYVIDQIAKAIARRWLDADNSEVKNTPALYGAYGTPAS